jgi:hypothetical protein
MVSSRRRCAATQMQNSIMKNLILACSMGVILISGSASAHDAAANIDPNLIIRTSGSGLDAWSYAEGNDHSGGMWEGATGYSSSAVAQQRPAYVGTIPSNREWSRLNTRQRRRSDTSY